MTEPALTESRAVLLGLVASGVSGGLVGLVVGVVVV